MQGHDVIRRARELGWTPQERNKTARKWFYFDGPVLLTACKIVHRWDMFTVGNQTTSSYERAVELLEEAWSKK